MCNRPCDQQWGQELSNLPVLKGSRKKYITLQCQIGCGSSGLGKMVGIRAWARQGIWVKQGKQSTEGEDQWGSCQPWAAAIPYEIFMRTLLEVNGIHLALPLDVSAAKVGHFVSESSCRAASS